jgi:hypothetical protein
MPLMTSLLTHGLIHGVAMESSVPAGCEIQTLADADSGTGQRFVKAVGCDVTADIAACLRGKSTTEIVRRFPEALPFCRASMAPTWTATCFPISRSN